jgi:hypothetical protein
MIQCEEEFLSTSPISQKGSGTRNKSTKSTTYGGLKVERVPLQNHNELLILLHCSAFHFLFGKYQGWREYL